MRLQESLRKLVQPSNPIRLRGKHNEAHPLLAIESFNEVTHQWRRQHHPDVGWSELSQDQILREDEDNSNQVQKILSDPVRKGMVKQWKEYKFEGSTIHRLDTWHCPI